MPDFVKPIVKPMGEIDAVLKADYELTINGLPQEVKELMEKYYPQIDFKSRVGTLALNCGCGGGNCVC